MSGPPRLETPPRDAGAATGPLLEGLLGEARRAGRDALLEHESLAVLETMGFRVPRHLFLRRGDDLGQTDLARLPGERLVVKAAAADIPHKSEVGAVRVVDRSPATVSSVLESMEERLGDRELAGFLIEEYIEHDPGLAGELLLGMRWTDDFGPVVTLGSGGFEVELLAGGATGGDAVAILSPSFGDRATIRLALSVLPLAPLLLGGFRGREATLAPERLFAAVESFLAFADEHVPHDVREFEVNPLAVTPDGLVALDALLRLGQEPRPSMPPRPLDKLARLLRPRSMALVGVSERMNPGHVILNNVLRAGFDPERVTVVKPGTERIEGVRCVPALEELPEPVDLLVLSVAAPQVPDLVETAVERRLAESVVVIPGGLGERRGSDAAVTRIREAVRRSRETEWRGPLVNGGNCLGIRSRPGRCDTMFLPDYKYSEPDGRPTPLAMISQSGAFAVSKLDKLAGLAPKYLISIGNQIDLTVGDYMRHLADDREVRVFGCYVEGFRPGDGLAWLKAASEIVADGRTVILYRAGRTPEGTTATASHTASIAGDYAVTRRLAQAAGVLVAESLAEFEELVRVACLMDDREIDGWRLGAVSNAGFECVAFADNLGRFRLPTFAPITVDRIAEVFSSRRIEGIVDVTNPADLTPITDDVGYEEVVRAVLEDPGVDVGVIGCVPMTPALQTLPPGPDHREDLFGEGSVVGRLARIAAEMSKAWVAVVDAGPGYDAMARELERRGIPTLRSADRALKVLETYAGHRLRRGR